MPDQNGSVDREIPNAPGCIGWNRAIQRCVLEKPFLARTRPVTLFQAKSWRSLFFARDLMAISSSILPIESPDRDSRREMARDPEVGGK